MTYSLQPAVHVIIEDDPALVREFFEWQLKTQTFNLRGAASSFGKFYGTFSALDHRALVEFFEHKTRPSPVDVRVELIDPWYYFKREASHAEAKKLAKQASKDRQRKGKV